jgi:secreted trypsin-like serine protease
MISPCASSTSPWRSTTAWLRLEINKAESVPSVGEDHVVMGLKVKGKNSKYLQDFTLPYLSNEECNMEKRYNGLVTHDMLSAGFFEVGKDSCERDSGGPIVKRTVNDDGTIVHTHVGVVSWGEGCARKNRPGVYSRTSSRYNWIKDTMPPSVTTRRPANAMVKTWPSGLPPKSTPGKQSGPSRTPAETSPKARLLRQQLRKRTQLVLEYGRVL